MFRFLLSFLVLIIFSAENTISYAQNRAKIDSLQLSLKREFNAIKKAETLLSLSEEYLPINSKSLDYAYSAKDIAIKQENPKIRAKALIAIAKGEYLLKDSYDEAKQKFNESEKLCIINHLYDIQVQTLLEWSSLEQYYNHYLAALEKLHIANSICTQNHKVKQAEIAYRIAELHLQNSKYSDAIAWSSICDSLSLRTKDTTQLGCSYRIKALVNCSNQNFVGVHREYRKVISLYKKYLKSDEGSLARIILYTNSLIDYATTLREIKQYDSSLSYLNQCLEYFRLKYGRDTIKYVPQHLMVQAYLAKSMTLHAQEGPSEIKRSKDSPMEYLEELTDTLTLADANLKLACFYLTEGSITKSLLYLKTYSKLLSKYDNPLKLVDGSILRGLAYLKIGTYRSAIGAYRGALRICKKELFPSKLVEVHTNIGNAFLFSEEPDSAISHAEYAIKANDNDVDSLIYYANCYSLATAYIMKGDLQKAQLYINKIIILSKAINKPILTKYGLIAADYIIANYYKQNGNYSLFLDYIDKSIKKAQAEGTKEVERDSYLLLAKYYKEIGKYKKANENLEKYDIIKSEILNLYSQKLITLYDLSERTFDRNAENQLLKKEREIQVAEIRHKEVIIFLTVIAAAALSILSVMLIVSNRRKNRAYQMLATQTNEILEKNKLLAQQTIAIEESEAMIRKQNVELVNLNKTKDKFFSIIAHDLRNPFTGLIGLTNYLIDHVKDMKVDDTTKCLLTINESSRQTYILLENLLDWAQTQLGSIKYHPEVFDLSYIADNTAKLFNATSTIKGISITNRIENETWVYADKSMIETILRNLIGNAIKFTNNSGQVEITSTSIDGKVQISVRDTGIGMSKEHLEKLFTLESINSRYGTAHEKGTGLGLVVCLEMIKKHEEKIWAESNLGEGATFYFTLKKMAQ